MRIDSRSEVNIFFIFLLTILNMNAGDNIVPNSTKDSISGGISLRGDLRPYPKTCSMIRLVGWVSLRSTQQLGLMAKGLILIKH